MIDGFTRLCIRSVHSGSALCVSALMFRVPIREVVSSCVSVPSILMPRENGTLLSQTRDAANHQMRLVSWPEEHFSIVHGVP